MQSKSSESGRYFGASASSPEPDSPANPALACPSACFGETACTQCGECPRERTARSCSPSGRKRRPGCSSRLHAAPRRLSVTRMTRIAWFGRRSLGMTLLTLTRTGGAIPSWAIWTTRSDKPFSIGIPTLGGQMGVLVFLSRAARRREGSVHQGYWRTLRSSLRNPWGVQRPCSRAASLSWMHFSAELVYVGKRDLGDWRRPKTHVLSSGCVYIFSSGPHPETRPPRPSADSFSSLSVSWACCS